LKKYLSPLKLFGEGTLEDEKTFNSEGKNLFPILNMFSFFSMH